MTYKQSIEDLILELEWVGMTPSIIIMKPKVAIELKKELNVDDLHGIKIYGLDIIVDSSTSYDVRIA